MLKLNYKSDRFKFLILAIGLFLIQYFFSLNSTVQLIFFGLGVILFGIPHGSLDHFIYHKERNEEMNVRSLSKFLLFYVGFAVLYSLLWLISVELSILLFILISAYHFGEMDLKGLAIKTSLSSRILFSLYGLLFLVNYLLFQFPDVESILLGFPGFEADQVERLRLLYGYQEQVLIASILFFMPILTFYLYQSKLIGFTQIEAVLQLLILMLIVFNLPILLGFGFYFNIWHAGLSMIEIKKFLGWQDKSYWFIYRKSWITNGASFLMIAVLFMIFQGNLERLLAIFFMSIAILTAPHMKVISALFSKNR
jgi:Brp/Blh family beta-carotene 15,15'-monooxygenase